MARITIKQLEERLKRSEDEKNRYFGLWQEAKKEIDERNHFISMREEERKSAAQVEIMHLLYPSVGFEEII